MHTHQFRSAPEAVKFMLAGNCTLTLMSKATGTRFTYRVKAIEDKPGEFFVSLLTGPDNQNDYQYMGILKTASLHSCPVHLTRNSKVGKEAKSYQALCWTLRKMSAKGEMPSELEIWHEGRCGRCNRPLTVPESIESGFGPECINHVH